MSTTDKYDDPIEKEQLAILRRLLADELTEAAKEGFLIVGPRFVDEFGNHRTSELRNVFKTESKNGRRALRLSLERMRDVVGGISGFEERFPVTIIPPRPAFPLFKIVGIETFVQHVYRVFDSAAAAPTRELARDYVVRTGRLPPVPRQRRPVRRTKPHLHWCSYRKWPTPEATARALQILPSWSDCRLRATLDGIAIRSAAYVAFNGDRHDPADKRLRFFGYYYEPITQDHPALPGGGLQIGVEGAPAVAVLEEWSGKVWKTIWQRQR